MCSICVVFVGNIAFTIKATDPDGDHITFTLNGPNKDFFEVNRDTGVVRVARQLDREV